MSIRLIIFCIFLFKLSQAHSNFCFDLFEINQPHPNVIQVDFKAQAKPKPLPNRVVKLRELSLEDEAFLTEKVVEFQQLIFDNPYNFLRRTQTQIYQMHLFWVQWIKPYVENPAYCSPYYLELITKAFEAEKYYNFFTRATENKFKLIPGPGEVILKDFEDYIRHNLAQINHKLISLIDNYRFKFSYKDYIFKTDKIDKLKNLVSKLTHQLRSLNYTLHEIKKIPQLHLYEKDSLKTYIKNATDILNQPEITGGLAELKEQESDEIKALVENFNQEVQRFKALSESVMNNGVTPLKQQIIKPNISF